MAYYHIDEVCLSSDSLLCANYVTSIRELHNEKSAFLFPNPADNLVSFQIKSASFISVYNSLGQNVFLNTKAQGMPFIINTSDWTEGIYFVTIDSRTYKLIIHH
jgi:hypothetical protein